VPAQRDGPCRWPHHTSQARASATDPDLLEVRVVGMVPAEDADSVRTAVITALAAGELAGPDGVVGWQLVEEAPGILADGEDELAERLGRS